jgi:nucleotide-binding universal stress UspA family protein
MSYQTILLHADAARSAPTRLRLAAMLAGQEQAHLICAAMTGISRYAYNPAAHDPEALVRPDIARIAAERAQKVLEEVNVHVGQLGLQSCELRNVSDDAYGGLVLQARYADLLILSQADRDDPAAALLHDLPEYVVLHSCRPVLVVPFAGNFTTLGENVLVAWDGSMQATRAVTQAIPILRRAARVTVAVFDPVSGPDDHGEEPGADIALYLSRHGIAVEVQRQHSNSDIGEALLTLADNLGADLLVMGANGHARYREILLGGVTRTVLNTMTVPVLLSH